MSFPLTGLLRGAALLSLVLFVTAVGLSRLAPPATNFRLRNDSPLVTINRHCVKKQDNKPRFFDPETQRVVEMPTPEDDLIEWATWSPWQDERGETQLVGRWICRKLKSGLCVGYGLARVSYPSGEVLDRVSTDVVPVSRPCFYPGEPNRVLFAAGDGILYRYRFADESPFLAATERQERPEPLPWKVPRPGDRVLISDPVWPTVGELHGRVIVSLSYLLPGSNPKNGKFSPSCLWWLQLSADGAQIIDAGPLFRDLKPPFNGDLVEHRFPNLTTTSDGKIAVAYLERRRSAGLGWTSRMALITTDAVTGIPTIDERQARVLSQKAAPTLPVFSADGRWVFVLETPDKNIVHRFSTADLLSSSQPKGPSDTAPPLTHVADVTAAATLPLGTMQGL